MTQAQRFARIEVAKQAMNFSAAHFTIFNQKQRENLHGHNFQVSCTITAPIDESGIIFDYSIIKTSIRQICDELDEKTILPEKSPYLSLNTEAGYTVARFNGERIPFLARDVITLPIANTTVEEFSQYFLARLLHNNELTGRDIEKIVVTVSSSPGQSGSADWSSP
jgi:6-pyruvoyltetrahydropterin/6-carboxytetrahydropterin synthase